MKIVYQNIFDKNTAVFVGEIQSFETSYLNEFGFQFKEGEGGIEKQAQRFLARHLLAKELQIDIHDIKKEGRAPLVEGLDKQFSLSHSGNKVAIIISDNRVGVDIEPETNKILRIKHKFVNEQEAAFIPEHQILQGASIVWGAKESMFKLYRDGALSYLNHLQLGSFSNFEKDKFDCQINKDGLINCKGEHDKIGDYRLVSVWED
jgi:phosphopantetheinyl transferase